MTKYLQQLVTMILQMHTNRGNNKPGKTATQKYMNKIIVIIKISPWLPFFSLAWACCLLSTRPSAFSVSLSLEHSITSRTFSLELSITHNSFNGFTKMASHYWELCFSHISLSLLSLILSVETEKHISCWHSVVFFSLWTRALIQNQSTPC